MSYTTPKHVCKLLISFVIYIHMTTIVLNPEQAARLDYEHNWAGLITFEGYLSIKQQQLSYLANQKGYEASK